MALLESSGTDGEPEGVPWSPKLLLLCDNGQILSPWKSLTFSLWKLRGVSPALALLEAQGNWGKIQTCMEGHSSHDVPSSHTCVYQTVSFTVLLLGTRQSRCFTTFWLGLYPNGIRRSTRHDIVSGNIHKGAKLALNKKTQPKTFVMWACGETYCALKQFMVEVWLRGARW